MLRREFFSSLAKASLDTLGSQPFYGTVDNTPYTFVPALSRYKPTIIVSDDLRLKERLYEENFNVIFFDKWPRAKNVTFWRKLFLRHDLTDEIYILCKHIPDALPSMVHKVACINKNSLKRVESCELPVLLLDDTGEDIPDMANFPIGSDIFVSPANTLNIKNSPAFTRLLSFFSSRSV